jgi:peptide/nickel transport system permease protein
VSVVTLPDELPVVVDEAAAVVASPATPPTATRAPRRRGTIRIVICCSIIACYAIGAVVGPILLDFDPVQTRTSMRLQPPLSRLEDGSFALFGTDQVGQDLFAQMLAGARISLLVGGATLVLAGLLGVTIGLVAGFFGGWSDSTLMRLADVQLTFPSILLAIFIAAVLGPSVVNVIIVLAISNWVTFARVNRSQVLSLKHREYVDAARTLNANNRHLMLRTIFPGCVAAMMVVATVELGHVILAEASLSFLGLGVPTDVPSWGTTISNGRNYLADAWWISTLPGIALAILVLTTGVLGDALRDRFDPRLRSAG